LSAPSSHLGAPSEAGEPNGAGAADSRRRLVRLLQLAHAGELAAGYAYRGHWKSVKDREEQGRIQQIEAEEWHHRELVAGLLGQLGARPSASREARAFVIGRVLGLLCHVAGWFAPMYGAGRLERRNIVEYEDAARYAVGCGRAAFIECLLTMAEVEWEHEQYFRSKVEGHPLRHLFPLWSAPPPRASIRAAYRPRRDGAA
jgi:rubrerythrin